MSSQIAESKMECQALHYFQQDEVAFSKGQKQFRYVKPGQKSSVPFRGLRPLIRQLYWPDYDYYEATRPVAKEMTRYKKELFKNKPDLAEHSHFSQDVSSAVHKQVEHVVRHRRDYNAQKIRDDKHLHPCVKHVFEELGRCKLYVVASEEIVYDPVIRLATAVDLVCSSLLDPAFVLLVEMKVGFSGGAWNASNGTLASPLDQFDNSPYHQACVQVLFACEMMRPRLTPGTSIGGAVLHVQPDGAKLQKIPDPMARISRGVYELASLSAQADSTLGRNAKKTTTAGRGGRRRSRHQTKKH